MRVSNLFWRALKALDAAGMPRLAARIANLVCNDRKFSVDQDGDRLTRQAEATFVCPNLAPSRYEYLRSQVVENWLYCYVPKEGDTVLDVGAGIGEETVIFSRLAGHVISVEAHPRTFRCLEKTIAANKLDNVTATWCAIADRDGEIQLSDGTDHLSNMMTSEGGIKVPARSLQSLCDDYGIHQIDFLKMNIEGAERLAIAGFGNLVIRNLVISCHDFLKQDDMRTMATVEDFLRRNGYSVTTRPDHQLSYTRCNLYARG
jgi:FkbM family methyltransferase